jgi:CheY-like chemotaxis protein
MFVESGRSIEKESAPARENRQSSGAWAGEPRDTRGCRILIVDDNEDVAESFAILLGLEGYDCVSATDGESAIRMFHERRPQVVLLDIGLPGRSGHEIARYIRALNDAEVLLIAVSGWAREADKERSYAAGFDHHLSKPVDYDRLVQLVRCGRSGAEPSARLQA